MKIVIVDFAASDGGALSILREFVEAVKKIGKDHEWIFLLSEYHITESSNIKVEIIKKNKLNRLMFDGFLGKDIINKFYPDVVLNFQNIPISGIKVPQILYLHQSIPFQRNVKFKFYKKVEFKYWLIQNLLGNLIKRKLNLANLVVVQTEWMKNAVINYASLDKKKIVVIPPTINFTLHNNQIREIDSNSFFYPTSDLLYKNIEILAKAANKIDDYEFNIDVTIERKLENKHINSIGKIPREDVFEKYSNSTLIFPSKIETVGLPLAEAKIMNSIILASDLEYSQEVLKNYNNAYFFNSDDSEELSLLMKKVITGEIKRNYQENDSFDNRFDGWKKLIDTVLRA